VDGAVGEDGIPDAVQDTDEEDNGAINYTIFDTDGDGRPDFQDLDADNDGINDVIESNGTDANGDGLADGAADTNGVPDTVAVGGNTPPDTDGDNVADFRDLDSDNDGINDVVEAGLSDPDNDGIIGTGTPVDGDDDGIADAVDGSTDFGDSGDPAPRNSDNDPVPDYRDLDSDNDSISDVIEGGNGSADTNGDGTISAADTNGGDTDGDGIPDVLDDDPTNFGDAGNSALPNTDGQPDGEDYIDTDSDDDGTNDIENTPNSGLDTNDDGMVNNPADPDGDGIANNGGLDGAPNDFGTSGVGPKPNTYAGFVASNATALGLDDNSTPGTPVVDPLTGNNNTGVTDGAIVDLAGLTDNPDGDIFNNLLEFAFCYDPGSGAKNFPTGERNEGVQLVHNADGTVDLTYSIPTGVTDVTYQLESSVDGQVWTAVTTTPTSAVNTAISGVSAITVAGVDAIATDALFRVRVVAVAATPEVTAFSPVVGLQITRILDFCQTYSDPALIPCPFSGEVASITGQVLTFGNSVATQDLTTVLDANRNYYVEVIGGTGLGHIFDITGFTANTVTLAEQTLEGLCSLTAPFNTLVTVPDLAGSQVIIREHRTIGDLFPATELDESDAQIAGTGFTRGADAASAANLYRWNRETNALAIYYLSLAGDWLNTNGGGVVNDFILPPGEGIFVHDLEGATSFDLVQTGDVRLNQLAVPLKAGLNFVASAAPVVAQSPDGTEAGAATATHSRQLNSSNTNGISGLGKFTLTGDNAVSAADQLLLWGDDALTLSSDTPTQQYDFLFLLSNGGQIERWVDAGAANPLSIDNDLIFEANRSIFMDVETDILDNYIASPISNN